MLVAGASGGVGQLVTAKLVEVRHHYRHQNHLIVIIAQRGYRVRALTRSATRPPTLEGTDAVDVMQGDCRDAGSLAPLVSGVQAVVCCTGTTAFPSSRWRDNNGPEQTDFVGVQNLVAACNPASVGRFVLLSSAGVERQGSFPYVILYVLSCRCQRTYNH